jgi:uncharacterized protein
MKIAITGASGLVGRRLLDEFHSHSLTVLGRGARDLPVGTKFAHWDALTGPPPAEGLTGADVVVHLAGEPVAQRWTDSAKARIRDSRVIGTRNLVEGLGRLLRPPRVLVCASAVGIYGSRGDEVLSEASAPGTGFLAEVCQAWEKEAEAAAGLGARVVRVRIGIVLAQDGGALAKMLPPFRAGLGGPLGSGRQWMSWIHLDDLAGIVFHAVGHDTVRGAINAVAPAPATNRQFTRALAGALHRPAFLPVPEIALRLLFGEMAEVLLGSQRALPFAAQASGYKFQHPDLNAALAQILGRS